MKTKRKSREECSISIGVICKYLPLQTRQYLICTVCTALHITHRTTCLSLHLHWTTHTLAELHLYYLLADTVPIECCPLRRNQRLLSLLVPWTTLVHEPTTCGGVSWEEPTHWDSTACWGLTPPSPNWQMITVPWPPSSAVLSTSAVIVWWDWHTDVCSPREDCSLWLSKLETYRIGESWRRTCVSQSHQKSMWKGLIKGCLWGTSLGERP